MTNHLDRREFLRVSTLGSAAVVFGGATLLSACDPGDLLDADVNGVRVHPGFSARTIATSGTNVAGTSYQWHAWPDGGACFALPDGGWSYVSNSELIPLGAGGAGFVRFDADANIVDAGSCLTGTTLNCGGGATPWGTWLSGEEYGNGQIWECDPIGAAPAVARPGMGVFPHEAAACHVGEQAVYLTEDRSNGGLYRFIPDTWTDLSSGTLQVLTEVDGVLGWADIPDPSASSSTTRSQVPEMKVFNGGEGIDISGNNVVFTTKGDDRVWSYDPVANELTVLYDEGVTPNGVLSGNDNLVTDDSGVIYVAEDGGDMQIVLVREDGSTFPVVQVVGVSGSEIAGPAFNPAGNRLYFSSQRNPGETFEVYGPWNAFVTPGPFNPPPPVG